MEFKHSGTSARPLAIACILAVVLQVALAPQLSVFGGRINFMLVLVAAAAVGGESRTLVYLGFFAGLFYDLTAAVPVGLQALLLCVTGYGLALMSRGINPQARADALRFAGVGIVGVNVVYGSILFFMGIETSLMGALLSHALASSVLDIAVAVPFLMLLSAGEQSRGFSARGGAHGTRRRRVR